MSRVFFTSDLHFGHRNLISSLRNGASTDDNAKLIIDNWNSKVHKKDIVYILGDITMETVDSKCIDYLKALRGQIRIVGGNHDILKCCKIYQELGIPVMGVLKYKGFLCTHVPIHPSELDLIRGNIHGHIHLKLDRETGVISKISPTMLGPKYYNVNTELHNFTPIPFDDILVNLEKSSL